MPIQHTYSSWFHGEDSHRTERRRKEAAVGREKNFGDYSCLKVKESFRLIYSSRVGDRAKLLQFLINGWFLSTSRRHDSGSNKLYFSKMFWPCFCFALFVFSGGMNLRVFKEDSSSFITPIPNIIYIYIYLFVSRMRASVSPTWNYYYSSYSQFTELPSFIY